MKKIISTLLTLLIVAISLVPAYGSESDKKLTVLFTHDMHSYIDEKADGTGGFARLKTVIDQTKAEDPNTVVVDGGDFAMGTLYQTIFSSDASELRLLGLMGFDATTLGNHEFDYGSDGLAKMLNTAVSSGDPLPEIFCSNIDWANSKGEHTSTLKEAMDNCGAKEYTVIEKGGVKIGLFGLMGEDAEACAPTSGLVFTDICQRAKEIVDKMKAQDNPDIIICLSHSGTDDKKKSSEDELLAKAVPDIDIIVSGHTHTTFAEPIIHNSTVVASVGEYVSNVGKMILSQNSDGTWKLDEYKLIPLDSSVTPDSEMLEKIAEFRNLTSSYLDNFNYESAEQVIAKSLYQFVSSEDIYDQHTEHTLGNILSDGFKYAANQALKDGEAPADFAVVPNGIIRATFNKGDVTVSDVFEVLSLGIGEDGIPGYPLISVYLTGKELKTACEIDASISGLMSGTMLFFSGLSFTFNPNRMILNKVTDVSIMNDDLSLSQLEDDKLYRIVADMYTGQMLGAVNDVSYGLLSLVPKDENGNAVTDFKDRIIYKDGKEVKAWDAVAQYLQSFDGGVIPERYSQNEGRKIVDDNKNLFEIIKNPNTTTLVIYGIVLLLIAIIVLVVVLIVKTHKKRKARKNNNTEK